MTYPSCPWGDWPVHTNDIFSEALSSTFLIIASHLSRTSLDAYASLLSQPLGSGCFNWRSLAKPKHDIDTLSNIAGRTVILAFHHLSVQIFRLHHSRLH